MYCNNREAIHFSVLEYPNNTNVHVAFKIPLKKIVCTLCFMPCLFFIYSHKVILENIQLVLLVWKSFLKETSINYYSIRNITNPKKYFTGLSLGSLKYILMTTSNSPQPVSVTSQGGLTSTEIKNMKLVLLNLFHKGTNNNIRQYSHPLSIFSRIS